MWNSEAMDPLEWLARLSDQIPDPGQHRTLFYGEYSNRVRGTREPAEAETREEEEPRPAISRSPAQGGARLNLLLFAACYRGEESGRNRAETEEQEQHGRREPGRGP